jgi:hypothetical protein
MEEQIISEQAYLDMCIALGEYGVTPNELDDVATMYLDKGTPKEDCYRQAFEEIVNLRKEQRKNDDRLS